MVRHPFVRLSLLLAIAMLYPVLVVPGAEPAADGVKRIEATKVLTNSALVDWGDGTAKVPFEVQITLDQDWPLVLTTPGHSYEQAGQYTITVLNRAPHAAAARAFVAFLLGKSGRSILERNGLVPTVPPVVSGRRAVPSDLKRTV